MSEPSLIYHIRVAIAAADALAAAIVHLDLFTELAREPARLADVCHRHGLHRRPADVLCTLLRAQGLLARDAAGRPEPTATAREFLVGGSPFDARPYYAAMADKPGVSDFLKVLRTGNPANWPGADGEADWHASMRTPAFAEAFTAAMDCRGRVLAPALALAAAVDCRMTSSPFLDPARVLARPGRDSRERRYRRHDGDVLTRASDRSAGRHASG